MEQLQRVLCLDFDDVITQSKRVIEAIIERIDNRATERHLRLIRQMSKNMHISDEEEKELLDEHFDLKDRILEEVDNKYKGIIDYEKVINIGNIYYNSVNYINYLCECGRYDQIYIVSHCNVPREVEAKRKFIERYIPKVKFIPVPFHKEIYQEGKKRSRTSKAQFVTEELGLSNLENYILIDDSLGNLSEWIERDGIAILFRPLNVNEMISGYQDNILINYPRITTISEIEIRNAITSSTGKSLKKIYK